MARYIEWRLQRGFRRLAATLALIGSCCAPLAHADCKPTGGGGTLALPLSPIRVVAPKGAPVGALLGSAHAAILSDVPFACTGADNVRELRVLAPVDTTSGLGNVYTTNLRGIGFRIVTRGGSFAGIDDGPRKSTYKVTLPPDANRLTGFAVDVDFVKTGEGQGGILAPGKLVSVIVGGTTLVDVVVPDGGIAFDTGQCAPVSVGGEMSTGVGTRGAFTQEAVVIGVGCGSNVNSVIGVGQGYVYGSRPALTVDVPAMPRPDAARDARAGGTVVHGRSGARTPLLNDLQSNVNQAGSSQWSSAGSWSGGGGYGMPGNVGGGSGPQR